MVLIVVGDMHLFPFPFDMITFLSHPNTSFGSVLCFSPPSLLDYMLDKDIDLFPLSSKQRWLVLSIEYAIS